MLHRFHGDYHAAFVIGFDGHNIAVVFHQTDGLAVITRMRQA